MFYYDYLVYLYLIIRHSKFMSLTLGYIFSPELCTLCSPGNGDKTDIGTLVTINSSSAKEDSSAGVREKITRVSQT